MIEEIYTKVGCKLGIAEKNLYSQDVEQLLAENKAFRIEIKALR